MTDAADRILWESDEEALYRTARGQEDTLRAEQAESGTTDAGKVQGAREARYADAIHRHTCGDGEWCCWEEDITPCAEVDLTGFVRAFLPVADAEVAAAVSEAQAEVARLNQSGADWHRWYAAEAQHAADTLAAERAEVERLRAVGLELLRTKDEYRADVERLREVEAGIRALADEWAKQDPAYWHMLHKPDVKRAIEAAQFALAEDFRALLAPSPAATTGETVPPSTYDELREAGWKTPADIDAAREEGRAEVRAQVAALRDEWAPMVDGRSGSHLNPRIVTQRLASIAAPVSSGEAAPLNLTDQMQGSSGEAGTGTPPLSWLEAEFARANARRAETPTHARPAPVVTPSASGDES